MDKECNYDCLKYDSEPFIDDLGFPYCRWCGGDIKTANHVARELTESMNKKIVKSIDDYFIEGLNRKGFKFKNKLEIEEFIKNRCRCADDVIAKEKTYFVDDKAFFFYKYSVEPLKMSNINDRNLTITANAGYYSFL
jgi:hypothetical protein